MKATLIISTSLLTLFSVSCSPQLGQEQYDDVSNPYAAADYVDDSGTPYETSDVNLAYDAPAVYDEPTVAPTSTAPKYNPSSYTAPSKSHKVVRGDSLWALSKKYGVPVASIKSANNMTKDTVILGTTIKIPAQ